MSSISFSVANITSEVNCEYFFKFYYVICVGAVVQSFTFTEDRLHVLNSEVVVTQRFISCAVLGRRWSVWSIACRGDRLCYPISGFRPTSKVLKWFSCSLVLWLYWTLVISWKRLCIFSSYAKPHPPAPSRRYFLSDPLVSIFSFVILVPYLLHA